MAQIVTITNPLTGQPAQVDQLDHTAQQIDDGLNIARGVSNPNLLDNWYFGNPVDQRGGYVVPPNISCFGIDETSGDWTTDKYYTIKEFYTYNGVEYGKFSANGGTYATNKTMCVRGYIGVGYTIDRYRNTNASNVLLIEDDGIRFIGTGDGGFHIKIEPHMIEIGRTYTLSVLVDEIVGTGYIAQWATPTPVIKVGMNTLTFVAHENTWQGTSVVHRLNGEVKVRAVKLELGSQQTLAHQENGNWVLNEIPDFGEQLARCQRYYYDSRFGRTANPNGAYAVRLDAASSHLAGSYRFPVTMRTKPSVKIYSFNGTENCISYWASGADASGVTASANEATVGLTGFNSVTMSSEVAANIYAFHIVANAEL